MSINEVKWTTNYNALRENVRIHGHFPDKHTTLCNLSLCGVQHNERFVSIALIVGGFFVPPLGIIDGSVLTAVGELLMFGVLAQVPRILDAVRNGKSIKVSKGDFGVEVTGETNRE